MLKNINLDINDKEMLVVFGPSGIGKTTLLNLIGALDKPDLGKVMIEDTDISTLTSDDLSLLRKNKVGFIFQDFNLIPHLTALDNIRLPVALDKDVKKKIERIYDMAQGIDIKDRLNHLPGELSTGERQRISILRAIINSPSIILADEPTADLDNQNSRKIIEILKGLNQNSGCTVVVATNDEQVAACFPKRFTLS